MHNFYVFVIFLGVFFNFDRAYKINGQIQHLHCISIYGMHTDKKTSTNQENEAILLCFNLIYYDESK